MDSDTPFSDGPPALTLMIGPAPPRFEPEPFTRAAAEILTVSPDALPAMPDGAVHLVIDDPGEEATILAQLSRSGMLAKLRQIEVQTAGPRALSDWLRVEGFALIDRMDHPGGTVLILRRDETLHALRTRMAEAEAARDALKAEFDHLDIRFRSARIQADEAIRAAKSAEQVRKETETRLALSEDDRRDLAARLAASEDARAALAAHLDRLNALVDEAVGQGPASGI